MELIVKCIAWGLNLIFGVLKLLPVRKKITYISRQMNSVPLDFRMVIDEFKEQDETYEHVVLAKMIPKGILGKISYCFHIFVQMYHIATSKAVVLDTYCIAISLLKQRESLVVIQMWHALGAFKKFGYSILDQEEGSSSKTARMMKMHENYTYVLSSSEFTKPYFAEAFHVDLEKVQINPLPRTDLLMDHTEHEKIVERIWEKYPKLKATEKKILVYAPTFRKEVSAKEEMQKAVDALIQEIDFDKYELVIKKHVLSEFRVEDDRVILDDHFTSLEFFHVADIIITDYSAVLFEALLMEKPICFYAFDYESYMKNRDFYINYFEEMPGKVVRKADELVRAIETEKVDVEKIKHFRDKMIAPCKESYTKDFVKFLQRSMNDERS